MQRDLMRRLEKLEAHSLAQCNCAKTPVWCRTADHSGALLPDVRPAPPPFRCPRHGERAPRQIIRQLVRAINGEVAPGFRSYAAINERTPAEARAQETAEARRH
jgi:hypothetical protein